MNTEQPAQRRAAAHGSQDRIWTYFQNEGSEVFRAARPRLDFLLRQIARRARSTAPRLLNIGTGDGYLELAAQSRGWQVSALDPDPAAIARLADRGIDAHAGYIENLPFPAEHFDIVVASEVLEHLTDEPLRTGIEEIARVLRPRGWFFGTVPYNENLRDQETACPCCGEIFHRWGHHQSFSFLKVRVLLEPRFEVQKLSRTAFVELAGRGLLGRMKGWVRILLGRLGETIANPTLYWIARRR